MKPGKRNLLSDVPGMLVGHGDDAALKSGATVITAATPFTAGVHVMGGAPGSRETDLLAPDRLVDEAHAIVLAGGSAFGLAAADGVMAGLREAGRGIKVGSHRIPIVPAAIIFDLNNGGDKDWRENPYPALGRKAFDSASDDFALGTAGAGMGAIAGDIKGGVGSASLDMGAGVMVAALAVVNSLGSPVIKHSGHMHFHASPFEYAGEFGGRGATLTFDGLAEPVMPKLRSIEEGQSKGQGNTTIAVIATNARLDKAGCTRLATAAHDGIARAIFPAHTLFDGDAVFAVSHGGKEAKPADAMLQMRLGHAASVCLARAIARGVREATPAPGDPFPCSTG